MFSSLFKALPLLVASVFAAPSAEGKTIFVNIATASSSGDGASWGNPFKYLQDALAVSKEGDDIWLAKGTYFPDDRRDGKLIGDREATFKLNGVNLYGGFAGGESTIASRNISQNPTYLDGAIWRDSVYDGAGDEVYWTLNVVTVEKNSLISGVTVQHGNASGYLSSKPLYSGGGALVKNGATLTVDQSRFYRNRAVGNGGAIAGIVVASRSVFEENSIYAISDSARAPSKFSGGAIAGTATLDGCQFINNMIDATSTWGYNLEASGGAIAGKVEARNCLFQGNFIDFSDLPSSSSKCVGGAISGDAQLADCQFIANSTQHSIGASPLSAVTVDVGGGAVEGRFTIAGCFFEGNFTSGFLEGNARQTKDGPVNDDTLKSGGGALLSRSQTSSIDNSVFYRNSLSASRSGAWLPASYNGGGIILQENGILAITSSTFYGNQMPGGQAVGSIILVLKQGELELLNNIFAANRGSSIAAIRLDSSASILRLSTKIYPTPSTTSRNLVDMGENAFFGSIGDIVQLGNTNVTLITADPRFVDPANPRGADNKWGTADDGLRLRQDSPANDVSASFYFWLTEFAGQPIIDLLSNYLAPDVLDSDSDGNLTEKVPVDAAGFVRIQDRYLDLGAYEYGSLAPLPEIDIQYPVGTSLTDNQSSIGFPSTAVGSSSQRTLTIRNTGPKRLESIRATIEGTNAADFRISQAPASLVNSNTSIPFEVTFTPESLGDKTAVLRVFSTDADENPFDIVLRGFAADPEIAVSSAGKTLMDGQSTLGFGRVRINRVAKKEVIIKNTGNGTLDLSKLEIVGKHASEYQLRKPTRLSVATGGQVKCMVIFAPKNAGKRVAELRITTNDRDESPFNIRLLGRGVKMPDIDVFQPITKRVKDGGKRGFGTVRLGATYTKMFTIKNTGESALRDIKVSFRGSKQFSVLGLENRMVKPGGKTTFRLQFRPQGHRLQEGMILIRSNDPDESPFNISVSGQGKGTVPSPGGFAKLAAADYIPITKSAALSTASRTSEDGAEYLTLTVAKDSAAGAPVVEVSSDRVRWYSGENHTTELVDDGETLKVRDNVPVSDDSKRFIRVRFTE